MNFRLERLALAFGLLLALGCGARSPLDTIDDQPPGTAGSTGGILGNGGSLVIGGAGGSLGGAGGRSGSGGAGHYPGSGGGDGGVVSLGGIFSFGGIYGGGGYYYVGGAGGQAGFGPGGSPVGGRGGTAGGAGGLVVGGRGGTYSIAGTLSSGGRPSAGGMMNTGGSAGGAAGSIRPDGGFGGGGIAGRDGGPDGRTGGTGGGADSGAGGTVATGGITCPGIGSNEELIDDLNDGNRQIPSVNGRVGSWTDSDDGTPGGAMYPDPVSAFTPTDTADPCRKYAAYVKGSGFSNWGADLWFGLGSPYNASKYTGISFWARIDSGTTAVVHVTFPDKDTYPDGGICKTNATGPTACYDHYGSRITLTSDWKKYTLGFSQISQDGWGHAGTAFDPASLYEVLFQIPVNATFSIWIDDVAFTM